MQDKTIAFIGGGNMAFALVSGLIRQGHSAKNIWVSNPGLTKRENFQTAFSVNVTADNKEAVSQADVVVFCVKPQIMPTVMHQLAEIIHEKKLLVLSVAAGVTLSTMQECLGKETAIVRTMPNTAAQLGCSATGLFANSNTSAEQKILAENLMQAAGLVLWVQTEEQINAVIATAGSAIAYFFAFMEAIQETGVELGLQEREASLLVRETALGAARMALENKESLAQLRRNVTSPNGTTEKALNSFAQSGLKDMVSKAMQAAYHRAEELSQPALTHNKEEQA
jgi:pyrroline-5-carboxylate reductase